MSDRIILADQHAAPAGQDLGSERGDGVSPVAASVPISMSRARWQRRRLIALVVLTGVGLLAAHRMGLAQRLTVDAIRDTMAQAGALGVLVYLGLFAVRDFIRVPGFVFVGAAVLAFGPWIGGLLGFLGANLAVDVCFLITRAVGGKAMTHWDRPLARRLLARLDRRPVLVVFLLRNVFMSVSALNWTLAISNVRFRDYVIGSLFGFILPTVGIVFLWTMIFGGVDWGFRGLFAW